MCHTAHLLCPPELDKWALSYSRAREEIWVAVGLAKRHFRAGGRGTRADVEVETGSAPLYPFFHVGLKSLTWRLSSLHKQNSQGRPEKPHYKIPLPLSRLLAAAMLLLDAVAAILMLLDPVALPKIGVDCKTFTGPTLSSENYNAPLYSK